MRRVDAALVAIAILLAAVWYALRVAPSAPEPSRAAASPAPLVALSSAPGSRPRAPGGGGRSTGAVTEAGAPGAEAALAIDVVHRHTLGSCRGRLSATPGGLRYDPTRPGDGFDVPRASVDRLDADPRKKVLAVKLRSGRTYNFNDARGRAEPLQEFQKAFAKPPPRATAP